MSASSSGCGGGAGIFGNGNKHGSAFVNTQFDIGAETDWEVFFSYRINGSGDGMTFMIQNSTAGADALSGGGGGLGYRNLTPSSVFEFDVFHNSVDPNNNHIGYSEDGSSDVGPALETVNTGYNINDGAEHFVWVDYDGGLDLLELYA